METESESKSSRMRRDDAHLALRSEELRAALGDALAGRRSRLAELLARYGGLPGPKANLSLAAAFGEAIAQEDKAARALLDELRRDPADADSARAFLPIAAAYGYAARLDRDPRDAWAGVHELAADDRAPVRLGLIAALSAYAARRGGNIDTLVAHAEEWLDGDDREHVYASQAIVLDVVASRRGLDGLESPDLLLTWLARVLDTIASSPRAAERSAARRRMVAALPAALAEAAASVRDGIAWLTERITEFPDPTSRAIFERTIDELRRGSRAQTAPVLGALRDALESTKKAPRDPTLIREGTGRGKKGRRRSR